MAMALPAQSTSRAAASARSARRQQQAAELPRPTLRTAAPFVAVAVIGLGSVVVPPHGDGTAALWLMGVTFLCCLVLLAVSLRRTTRTWVDPAIAFMGFPMVAFARDATGGGASGLTPLILLPILWLVISGTRRDIAISGILTATLFIVPVVAIGAPKYPISDWRLAMMWVAVVGLVVPVFKQLVEQLARETRNVREAGVERDGIMLGARLSSMIATDLDGTITSFSLGAEEMLHYSAEEMVGKCDPGVFHDPGEVVEVAEELGVEPGFEVFVALARRGAHGRIWTYIRSDGRRLWVRLVITELFDTDGETTGYLGVAIDVTEGTEAERALAGAEARWRVLMDHLPELTVVMVGEDRRIRVVAGAGALRQGMRGTEGKRLAEVSNSENARIVEDLLQSAFAGREAEGELVATASGAEHELLVSPLPPDPTGRQALILARDVSDERRRERALVQAKERAERLFEDAPYGLAVLTREGRVLQANAALLAMTGRDEDEVVERPFAELCLAQDGQLERYLADVLSPSAGSVETDWMIRGPKDAEVHAVLSSCVLSGEDGADDVVLVNVIDVSERRRYEQRLAHLASHDALTGLANRRHFDEELARHEKRCQRYGPTGALLLLDLDNFKEVNDTLGHGAGDELIISTAAFLKSGVRDTDIVARLGGDEFAILLPDADRDAAEVVAASVVSRVREHTATLDGTRRRVTASVGAVTFAAAAEHVADILALADMTMYDAKEAGRNRYVVLDEDSARQPRSGARLAWQSRIERALENDAFVLHLQPILDLRTDTIGSAEVLLRLADTDELVSPARFLYVAERAGLVQSVDAWVLRHAVPMLANLRRIEPSFQLEVNLSGLSLGHPAIEREIVDTLSRYEVDPSALVLEITETAAVADVELARQFAERMSALGCKFALDDFGAGFGSFYYLKHLLFDYVKIDGEFVATSHKSSIDRTILRSIAGIARDLGKRTVAEFVAEPAILDVVRAEGVDLAQGFLIGEPVPYDEFVSRFLTGARWSIPDRASASADTP